MLSEGKRTAEFLVSEAPGTISRDNVTVTVPAATVLAPGSVLGKIAATGKYALYDEANSDGTETAAGVLYAELDNSEGVAPVDMDAVVINWSAEVRLDDLEFEDGVDEDGAVADLAALGVKARS